MWLLRCGRDDGSSVAGGVIVHPTGTESVWNQPELVVLLFVNL